MALAYGPGSIDLLQTLFLLEIDALEAQKAPEERFGDKVSSRSWVSRRGGPSKCKKGEILKQGTINAIIGN